MLIRKKSHHPHLHSNQQKIHKLIAKLARYFVFKKRDSVRLQGRELDSTVKKVPYSRLATPLLIALGSAELKEALV